MEEKTEARSKINIDITSRLCDQLSRAWTIDQADGPEEIPFNDWIKYVMMRYAIQVLQKNVVKQFQEADSAKS